MANDRFKDAVWAADPSKINIVIGGVGGIGSWLTLFLSRIGYTLFLYDDDIFDQTNLSGQFVTEKQLGRHKVHAIRELITLFGGTSTTHLFPHKISLVVRSFSSNIMVSAFDNMVARKDNYAIWKKTNVGEGKEPALLIDGRLDLERLQIFCVTQENYMEYESKHLFDDSEVPDAACTLKQTSHAAAIIAGIMTSFITNFVSKEKGSFASLPFFYEQILPLSIVNQEFVDHEKV